MHWNIQSRNVHDAVESFQTNRCSLHIEEKIVLHQLNRVYKSQYRRDEFSLKNSFPFRESLGLFVYFMQRFSSFIKNITHERFYVQIIDILFRIAIL